MFEGLFKRTTLSDRQERAVRRRCRTCVRSGETGSASSPASMAPRIRLITVRFAARLAPNDECDIIVLYVRPVDQGLWSGGLQVKLARQNMMEAGFELPGVRDLKKALAILKEEGIDAESWPKRSKPSGRLGRPGRRHQGRIQEPEGRSVVLKLKTAPDVANGILDQYELGPYNLIILGEPSRWRSEFKALVRCRRRAAGHRARALLGAGGAQKPRQEGFFICTDGTSRSMQAVRRAAVLAHAAGEPITLFSVAPDEAGRPAAEEAVANARALLKAMKIDVADTRTAVGEPAEEIIEAGSLYKLIVVTDEGRSRIERLFRGSIATEVVRGARTSVLDVR